MRRASCATAAASQVNLVAVNSLDRTGGRRQSAGRVQVAVNGLDNRAGRTQGESKLWLTVWTVVVIERQQVAVRRTSSRSGSEGSSKWLLGSQAGRVQVVVNDLDSRGGREAASGC